MNVPAQTQFVEPVCLLLVHNPYIYSMQVYFLPNFNQIVNSTLPVGIGEEIIIKDFYPFSVGVELDRFDRVYLTFFVMNEAERTSADTAARKELDRERVLRI